MADTGAFTARVVLLLIIPFLHKTANAEEHCRAVNSIANRALEGHVIGVSTSSSVEKCHIKCEDEPKCYSFNYIFSSQSCELSKATRLSHPKQFLPRENVVYFESLHRRYHACVHPPCKNGGTCIILSQSPGYQCKCHLSYIGKDCQVCDEKALGMNNRHIPDYAISASSFEPDSPPSSGRIYSRGGWRALSNDTAPYLEIRFTFEKLLIAVATQGWEDSQNISESDHCWTTEYFLEYKNSGTGWITHMEGVVRRVFIGNSDAKSNVKSRISQPFRCTAVRIRPIKWKERPCLRSEVYGCKAYR